MRTVITTLSLEHGYQLQLEAKVGEIVKKTLSVAGKAPFQEANLSELQGLLEAIKMVKKGEIEILPQTVHVSVGLSNLGIWRSREFKGVDHRREWAELADLLEAKEFRVLKLGTLMECRIPMRDDLEELIGQPA